jgi:protein ImuB
MAFAAIYIPNFPVEAAIRMEPALRGTAIALVCGTGSMLKVVAVNQQALNAGVELGMPRTAAEQFESVQIRLRSEAHEKSAHAALLDLSWSISPRVEDAAPDTIVIDLAGLSSLFGSHENIANQLLQRIPELGLTAHVAVSFNIEAAIHAARRFPAITLIPRGEESRCLSKLPVSVFDPSPAILETLELWGVHTCETLATLPILQLSERLGQEGVRLHELARGVSVRSMILAEPGISFEEELELEDSVEELEPLSFLLGRLLDQLCARLTARSLAIYIIRLRFSLDPAGREDIQIRKKPVPKNLAINFERTITLPVPMRNPKLLLNLLRFKLQSDPPKAPIQKIYLAAEPAKPRAIQKGLFLPSSPDVEKLELTIARLANLVGESNIGSPQLTDTHRPDAFCMNQYIPSCEEPKLIRPQKTLAKANGQSIGVKSKTIKPTFGFRMFRPPLPASVKLQKGQPANVLIRGARGEVIAASGPWRSSGDWWREDAWHQDEWDLEICFHPTELYLEKDVASQPQHGLYRFYFDSIQQKWFVRGIYD